MIDVLATAAFLLTWLGALLIAALACAYGRRRRGGSQPTIPAHPLPPPPTRGYQPTGPDVDLSRTIPPQVPSAARRPGSD